MVIAAPDAPTFRVGFLLIDGFALMSFAAAAEPLRAANLLAGHKVYDVRHLAVGERAVSSGGAIIEATAEIGRDLDFDLVLVVAGGEPASFRDRRVFAWLRQLDLECAPGIGQIGAGN